MKSTGIIKQKPRWGALIKTKRIELGMSQTEFGVQFGVTHAAVSDWERDITDPPGEVTWMLRGDKHHDR